jgi:hypothetical protein
MCVPTVQSQPVTNRSAPSVRLAKEVSSQQRWPLSDVLVLLAGGSAVDRETSEQSSVLKLMLMFVPFPQFLKPPHNRLCEPPAPHPSGLRGRPSVGRKLKVWSQSTRYSGGERARHPPGLSRSEVASLTTPSQVSVSASLLMCCEDNNNDQF